MPYISTERVSEIRKQIKKEFPKFKFSIRTRHHSSVYVTILSGPFEMITTEDPYNRRHESVNHFYIDEHYAEFPKVKAVLKRIYKIMNEGNYTEVYDGDYGAIPSFYCNIEIGSYEKPYKVIE